jgi:type I restriction enzyme S subunit
MTTLGWAPSLPEHWKIVPLNFVAKMGTGHTPDRSKPEYWENCTIPWITLTDASQNAESLALLMGTHQQISEVGMRAALLCCIRQELSCCRGPLPLGTAQ